MLQFSQQKNNHTKQSQLDTSEQLWNSAAVKLLRTRVSWKSSTCSVVYCCYYLEHLSCNPTLHLVPLFISNTNFSLSSHLFHETSPVHLKPFWVHARRKLVNMVPKSFNSLTSDRQVKENCQRQFLKKRGWFFCPVWRSKTRSIKYITCGFKSFL